MDNFRILYVHFKALPLISSIRIKTERQNMLKYTWMLTSYLSLQKETKGQM